MTSIEEQPAKPATIPPWRSKTIQNLHFNKPPDAPVVPSQADHSAALDFAQTRSDPMEVALSGDTDPRWSNTYLGLDQAVEQYRASAEDTTADTLAFQQDLFILRAEQHRMQAGNEAETGSPAHERGENQHLTNIYITDLPKDAGDDTLHALGSACGTVISHKAMLDNRTGTCKGFGFLMYATHDEARHAVQWLGAHGFNASFAKESFSARLRRMGDSSSTNVYLSNLPIRFTEAQLEQLFAPHPIASLKILQDVNGESRGVGFVRLMDRATAQRCIQRLHGRILPGTTLPLQVRFADSEAQKSLKKLAHQKQTLDSLILPRHDQATHDTHRFRDSSVTATSGDEFRASQNGSPSQLSFDHLIANNSAYSADLKQADLDYAFRPNLSPPAILADHSYHPAANVPYPGVPSFGGYNTASAPSTPLSTAALPHVDLMRQAGLGYGKHLQGAGMYPIDLRSTPMARMYSGPMPDTPLWSTMSPNALGLFPALPLPVDFSRYGSSEALHSRWNPAIQPYLTQDRILSNGQNLRRELEQGMRQSSHSAQLRASMPHVGIPRAQNNASLRSVSDPLAARNTRNNMFVDVRDMPSRRRAAVSADNSIDEGQGSVREEHEDDLDYGSSSSSIEFQM